MSNEPEDDRRRREQREDEQHDRAAQAETAELARLVRHNAHALAAMYGVDVDTGMYQDLLEEHSRVMKLVSQCEAIPQHLRHHFWESLLEMELSDEGANQEIQLFINSLLEDLDLTHPAAPPLLRALRDLTDAARRYF